MNMHVPDESINRYQSSEAYSGNRVLRERLAVWSGQRGACLAVAIHYSASRHPFVAFSAANHCKIFSVNLSSIYDR